MSKFGASRKTGEIRNQFGRNVSSEKVILTVPLERSEGDLNVTKFPRLREAATTTVLSTALPPAFAVVLTSFALLTGFGETNTASAADKGAPAPAIERFQEGRNFYNAISIPSGAETLYLSGAGAEPETDGSWGTMEEQAIDIFNTYKTTLEDLGWSMEDIVQVRVFAVAGENGALDFDGFNAGYQQFFGSDINRMKPVRSFVQVANLVRDGWLAEVEIRAARVPE